MVGRGVVDGEGEGTRNRHCLECLFKALLMAPVYSKGGDLFSTGEERYKGVTDQRNGGLEAT